jgi:Putative  PD-(D/E)XK family member, (DUF4420)
MLSDSPWRDLKEDGIDSRRVDHVGKWSFFWAIMPGQDPALALVLNTPPAAAPGLPKLRSLETGFAFLSGGPTFYLRLKDHAQVELFETLCRDVISFTALATTETEALTRAIARMYRWHYLLRGGRGGGLSEEEQKGLIGELAVLEWLSELTGPRAAITAWTGPTGSPKDFELQGHCIEVKARRAAAQPYVRISNEFQLADVEGHRLWLSVLAVDKVTKPFGNSLDVLVDRTASRFRGEVDTELLWEAAISASGYRVEDDYSEVRWVDSDPAWHEVRDGFPRIDLPLRTGVGNLKYSIALAACAPFKVELSEVSKAISTGYETR